MASERVSWITHGGNKILLNDFSNLPELKFLEELAEMKKELSKLTEPAYLIIDISQSTVSPNVMKISKEISAYIHENKLSKGTAAIGITGITKNTHKYAEQNRSCCR